MDKDRQKLRSFTAVNQNVHFNYCCGALVFFKVKEAAGNVSIEWYKSGELDCVEEMKR